MATTDRSRSDRHTIPSRRSHTASSVLALWSLGAPETRPPHSIRRRPPIRPSPRALAFLGSVVARHGPRASRCLAAASPPPRLLPDQHSARQGRLGRPAGGQKQPRAGIEPAPLMLVTRPVQGPCKISDLTSGRSGHGSLTPRERQAFCVFCCLGGCHAMQSWDLLACLARELVSLVHTHR